MPLYRADVWTFTPPHTLHSLGELPTITDALNVCQGHTPERLRWHMPTQGRFFAVNSVAEYRIVRIEHPRHEQEVPVTVTGQDSVRPSRPQCETVQVRRSPQTDHRAENSV
ncbi:hypothetical protein GCM10008939_23760 [Deinococcus aquiradiocola]|uniref:Uncharacterized protein n=1 Tax=Deinococcus aquiradiocola TaxID=393059 RepID=A0A917PHR3_9DEIO|nr:hypothetical protein GCM10008939_23760 [Deinococcus aquiradiocola]